MGSVFVHSTMSHDGFIAGPNDEIAWAVRYFDEIPKSWWTR